MREAIKQKHISLRDFMAPIAILHEIYRFLYLPWCGKGHAHLEVTALEQLHNFLWDGYTHEYAFRCDVKRDTKIYNREPWGRIHSGRAAISGRIKGIARQTVGQPGAAA